jgi:hypothetical protein
MVDILDLKQQFNKLQLNNIDINKAITQYTNEYAALFHHRVVDTDDLFATIDGEIQKFKDVGNLLHIIKINKGLRDDIHKTTASLTQLERGIVSASASQVIQPQSTSLPPPRLTSPSPATVNDNTQVFNIPVDKKLTQPSLKLPQLPPLPPTLPSPSLNLPPSPSPAEVNDDIQVVDVNDDIQVVDVPVNPQMTSPSLNLPQLPLFPPTSPPSSSSSSQLLARDLITKRIADARARQTNIGISSTNTSSSQSSQSSSSRYQASGASITPGGHLHIRVTDPLNSRDLTRHPGSNPIYAQVGGRKTEYEVTPGSNLFVRAVTALYPISSPKFHKENPDFGEQVAAGFMDGSIEPVSKTENEDASSQETSDDLSPAEQSADNPEVIKNLIMNLKVKPDIKSEIIQQYEQLVMMCQRKTALELIKPLLKPKKDEIVPSDREILTTLGWNGSENELLYDINKRRQGQIVFVNGLFSFFCFDNGEFSVAFSRHCGKNYACMLNWVLIAAFRLRIRDPAKYTDAAIIELIKNMHGSLYGFLVSGSIADNFTRRTDGNADFYIEGAKKAMKDGIFYDVTLGGLVGAIKVEVGKIPEPKDTLSTYFPRKSSQTTVKSGGIGGSGGGHKSIKLTRKRYHHKIHKIAHTIKVTKNPTTNTKKTRRHVSHVKT